MRVYYEKLIGKGVSSNISFYTAIEGFTAMGFHMIEIEDVLYVPKDDYESVALGSIGFIHAALKHLGKTCPETLDYPTLLRFFLGRKIWEFTISQIDVDKTKWNVFIKPKGFSKKFVGRVVEGLADLRGTAEQQYDVPIWISETVKFEREWRVFIRYGNILDIRPYKGNWKKQYDASVIEQAVAAYEDAPNGYAMDFGVTQDGRTLLVEVNDGYSLGAYGLFYLDYAKLLSARWAQLAGTTDLCSFDL
jgi:hypothetical protein